MELEQVTYQGPSIDDVPMLRRLPHALAALVGQIDGFIQFGGGLHVRGACKAPDWHSLRTVLEGPLALHSLYPAVLESDVPFAQDCVGDQFLLRGQSVLELSAETGELTHKADSFKSFLQNVQDDPIEYLSMAPLLEFSKSGGVLTPGRLLHAYPPYCMETETPVSLRDVPALELLRVHAELAKEIRDWPDGASIEISVTE